VGYFAPHEGSSTLFCGIYNVASLAIDEEYCVRLAEDPLGRENSTFARRDKFFYVRTERF
jgi:hypothetical protein